MSPENHHQLGGENAVAAQKPKWFRPDTPFLDPQLLFVGFPYLPYEPKLILKPSPSPAEKILGQRGKWRETLVWKGYSMKSYAMHEKFSVRRLDRASKHVSALWFPINLELLANIRRKLRDDRYSGSPEELFEDLKQDFALFTFVVKELMGAGVQENIPTRVINNPTELIDWAGVAKVAELINDDTRLPLNHLLQSLSPIQASRLRETAIIASTAELLSAKTNLNPQTGFSRGVLRETGLNLIAWNYPSLYSRVLKKLEKGRSLDEQLSQELGFSPVTLAMRVLHPSSPIGTDGEGCLHDSTWEMYDRLCEVGAALARADSPESYPSAEKDWKLANEYLLKTVGKDGIALIRIKAAEYSKEYSKYLSGIFKPAKDFNPERSIGNFKKQSKYRGNRYINQCSAEVQASLQSLYAHLSDTEATARALEMLIRQVIPEAGFTGGCVYLVDPSAFALMPRTVFGSVKLRTVERIMLKPMFPDQHSGAFTSSISLGSCGPDLAATALSCAQPVIERHDDVHCSGITGIYASLGDNKKVGVLYLEAPEATDMQGDHQTMRTFKAMRQALADALKLD
jgi:hypothetical protein